MKTGSFEVGLINYYMNFTTAGTEKAFYLSFFFHFTATKIPPQLSSYRSSSPLWTHPKSRELLFYSLRILCCQTTWLSCSGCDDCASVFYSQTEDHIHGKPEHFRIGGAGNPDLWGFRRSDSHHELELRRARVHWWRAGKIVNTEWMTAAAKWRNPWHTGVGP